MTKDIEERRTMSTGAKITIGIVVLVVLAIGGVTWGIFSKVCVGYVLNADLDRAIKVAKVDWKQGRAQIEEIFEQATKNGTEPETLMELHRKYASFLYKEHLTEAGDYQIQKAIELAMSGDAWKKFEAVASQLSQVYYDRAWEKHDRWLAGKTKDTGLQDQLRSIEIAENRLQPNSSATNEKRAYLAVIFADIGDSARANSTMERAVSSIADNKFSKAENWYIYAMLARMKAVQRKYKEALEAWLELKDVTTEAHCEKGWKELVFGLRHGSNRKKPETALARHLFAEEDFAELDRLSKEYLKSDQLYWTGFEQLDYFSTAIEGESNNNEKNYKIWVARLERWLKKYPKSDLARTCLAQTHIYRAWEIDDDEEDTNYKALIQKANDVMDVDPDLPNRFPKAFVPALRLAAAKHEKADLFKVIDAANKRWPHYFCIDSWAFKFQDYETLGEKIDRIAYAKKRADSMGGSEGDKYYARMAFEFFDDCYGSDADSKDHFDWDKVKTGFASIIKDFPNELEARIAFITIANAENDDKTLLSVFDGFEPKVQSIKK
ncbi:MAG: hypothetical protein DKT66_22355 [Candidatus Melainabacteria bacterium]|nr:MAG: hypothetical protein DKT66_22355 [Candidatus Melainabacteria bacterium]